MNPGVKYYLPYRKTLANTIELGLIRSLVLVNVFVFLLGFKDFYQIVKEPPFQNPILLPSDHYLVGLLIREKHIMLNHASPLITLNNLREKFWILKGR